MRRAATVSSHSAFASIVSALLPADTACRSASALVAAIHMESAQDPQATIGTLLRFYMDTPLPHWIILCSQTFMQRSSRSSAQHHHPRT
jgi:hypothetical protein